MVEGSDPVEKRQNIRKKKKKISREVIESHLFFSHRDQFQIARSHQIQSNLQSTSGHLDYVCTIPPHNVIF